MHKSLDNRVYHRVSKWCDQCDKQTVQVVEATVSTCTKCHVSNDSDAEELFAVE